MEIRNREENGKQELDLTCPFFQVRCVSFCPAWLAAMEDCTFHVCLTDVEEVFFEAAAYLDQRIGLAGGTAAKLMNTVRKAISTRSCPDAEIVKHCMDVLLSAGIMGKLTGYLPAKLGNLLSGVEQRMVFDFKGLFDEVDEKEPEQE